MTPTRLVASSNGTSWCRSWLRSWLVERWWLDGGIGSLSRPHNEIRTHAGLIAVRRILQHNTAHAHAGFVRDLTSDNVPAEYLFCAIAQCESARVNRWRKSDATGRFLETSSERPRDTPGFGQRHST